MPAGTLLSSTAVALAWRDDPPNADAIAISPTLGWWLLACALCVTGLAVVHRDALRRFWLRLEDPRSLGLFRIVFAFLVVCNTNDFWEYFEFLFTDEGILPADVARQSFASAQFRGYGDGLSPDEPEGFFDFEAVLVYLEGPKHSLLWFWDSPRAFWIHLVAFEAIAFLFMLGVCSRVTGVLTWAGMLSIYGRNRLFWEGTEVVYFCFAFYLALSRCGHAYSIDNWWRCRRLRRAGRLSEPGGPAHGAGVPAGPDRPALEAVYRSIPGWPRRLMLLQLAALYCTTGAVKTGSVWARGDAFYYAWNLDHFYRIFPQRISAVFGTNLFRVMTWVTHWWEVLFPLVLVGLAARFALRERIPGSARARLASRALWIALGLAALAVALVAYPVHDPLAGLGLDVRTGAGVFAAIWLGAMTAAGLGWWRLHTRPFEPARAERWSARWWTWPVTGPILLFNRLRGHTDRVDLDWFCRWFLGRRVWLVLGLVFHLHLAILMNIGLFPIIMMATYLAWLESSEADALVRALSRAAGRLVRRPWGRIAVPPEDPTLPHLHRDGRHPPAWAWWTFAVVLALGVVVQVPAVQAQIDLPQVPTFLDFVLVGALLVLAWGVLAQLRGRGPIRWVPIALLLAGAAGLFALDVVELHRDRPGTLVEIGRAAFRGEPPPAPDRVSASVLWCSRAALRIGLVLVVLVTAWGSERTSRPAPGLPPGAPAWAYGPLLRVAVGLGIAWHVTAVAVWLAPDKDSLEAFRGAARRPFATWLVQTHTDQSWGMFAPNPPRHNVFHKVLVTDADRQLWDLRTDVYAPERMPIPWIWNDRMRKMNRRMSGGESGGGEWYQKWFARWICRDWALTHGGRAPLQVELVKMSYRIPGPEEVRELGWYVPADLLARSARQESLYVEQCDTAVMGQLSDEIRARHGLPALEGELHPWIKHRRRNWDAEREPPRTRDRSTRKSAALAE